MIDSPQAHSTINADAGSTEPVSAQRWSGLWRCMLQVAQRRRSGAWPGAAVQDEAEPDCEIAWQAGSGWMPAGPWPAAVAERFALFKPLLDVAPGAAPWLIAQLGQSLDGCVATHTGDSNVVTGEHNLDHLHRLRALCDAVIVGAGTAAADNPRLTTRRVPGDNPTRVVLDPALGLSPRLSVFTDGAAPTLWLYDERHGARAESRHQAAVNRTTNRTTLLPVPGLSGVNGEVDSAAVTQALAGRGLQLLFVEGGGATVSAFVRQKRLHRLHLAIAPVLVGHGRPGLRGPLATTMADALRPPARVWAMGDDVLWDIELAFSALSAPVATR
jgi:diaminohydroxyphosphoribosylaminopyrimidine deaminase / 5-amino-6-(5-phosphoribosylamino)uracil reductase